MAQIIRNFPRISLLRNANAARLRINLCRIGKDWAVKALVDDLLVLDVVVREHAEQHERDDEKSSQPGTKKRVPEAATEAFDARNFYFNSHVPSGRSSPCVSLRLMAGQSVTCWC